MAPDPMATTLAAASKPVFTPAAEQAAVAQHILALTRLSTSARAAARRAEAMDTVKTPGGRLEDQAAPAPAAMADTRLSPSPIQLLAPAQLARHPAVLLVYQLGPAAAVVVVAVRSTISTILSTKHTSAPHTAQQAQEMAEQTASYL